MDRYSRPIKECNTVLARLFEMDVRRTPTKPGRELHVVLDNRFPLIEGFQSRYSYFVKFDTPGSSAGNHFHKLKQELFLPIVGEFVVFLQDPNTHESESITLHSEKNQLLYIKAGIAHRVESLSPGAILFVHATSPNIDGDEFPIDVQPPL